MAHLSHEEKLEYTDLFLKVNEQFGRGDGALSIEEFEKFLIICGFRLPKATVAEKFAEHDTDGNWRITLDEFLAKMPNIIPSGSALSMAAKVRRKYNEFDITNDGYITYEEMKAVLARHGRVDEDWLRSFVKEWDKDGDGRIDFEEFLVMYIKTIIVEDAVVQGAEDEEMVEKMTQLILSSDKLRRLCYDRNLIKAGVVAMDDVKSVMSDVKIQLSEDQFNACITELSGEEDGKVHLEDFIKQYEAVIIKAYDEADAAEGGNEKPERKQAPAKDVVFDTKNKSEVASDGTQDRDSQEPDKRGTDPSSDNTSRAGSSVKGMVEKLEKLTVCK